MKRVIELSLLVAWALWFGGMISLFLFVMRLFITDREIATHAAPILFIAFAGYQMIVGIIACTSGTLLAVMTGRKPLAAASLLMIIALGLGIVIRSWTFEMVRLNRTLVADVARFQTLHHNTTTLYTTAAVLLFIAGLVGAVTLLGRARQTVAGTAPASGSPGEAGGRSTIL